MGISRFLVSKSKELKIGVTQICKDNKIALFGDSGNTNREGCTVRVVSEPCEWEYSRASIIGWGFLLWYLRETEV